MTIVYVIGIIGIHGEAGAERTKVCIKVSVINSSRHLWIRELASV